MGDLRLKHRHVLIREEESSKTPQEVWKQEYARQASVSGRKVPGQLLHRSIGKTTLVLNYFIKLAIEYSELAHSMARAAISSSPMDRLDDQPVVRSTL